MTQETWKPIPGFADRYQVSSEGRIKSLPFLQRYLLRNGVEAYRRTKERILKDRPNNSGYRIVQLWLDDQATGFTVHRLVAAAFLPNPNALPEVNHKDGVKLNCRTSNLEWETRSGNRLHAVATGLNSRARRVVAPSGKTYPSIAQAAAGERVAHRTAATWSRA